MGHYAENGTRLTRSSFPTTPYVDPDPLLKVTARIYKIDRFSGDLPKTEGTKRTIAFNVGDMIRTSDLNDLFPAATVTSLSPATGPAAGGTVVTAKGTNLDGVTAITVGGTAATAVTVVDTQTVRFTTPAKAAGASTVVITDDSGAVTKTNAFTYV